MLASRQLAPYLLTVFVLCQSAFASGASMKCGEAMRLEAKKDFAALQRLADDNDPCALLSLARALMYGDKGLAKDVPASLRYNRLAAEAGLDIAQYELAIELMVHGEPGKDDEEIVKWLREAAAQGSLSAKTLLGEFLITGRYVQQDIAAGLQLLVEADGEGDPVANQLLQKIAAAVKENANTQPRVDQ